MTTKLIIGPGRLSYPNILSPKPNDAGKDVWSTALLLPPEYDTKPILNALKEAWLAKFGTDKDKWPKNAGVRKPEDVIKDAEEIPQYGEAFRGWHVVNASCYDAPGVIDAAKNPVSDKKDVYPGRWGRISVNAYGYTSGKKGVTLGLNNVQVLKHDDALAGRTRATDDFDEVAEEMGVGADDWS